MDEKVILLWTGGWDSTFRLLQLVEDTKATIQPLYLVDEIRGSTPREIDTMRSIRAMIKKRWPDSQERLLPTDYGSYRATEMEPHHREMWETLRERGRVGLQYPILASYAEQNGIDRMELSVEARSNSESTVIQVLEPLLEPGGTASDSVHILPKTVGAPEALFCAFEFPLLGYTKQDMKKESERRQWMHIMNETWFCFDPTFGLPCGSCQPCKIAQKEGMKSRVGYLGPLLCSSRRQVRSSRRQAVALLEKAGLKSKVKSMLGY